MSGWIFQSSVLPVFLIMVQALLTKMAISTVSQLWTISAFLHLFSGWGDTGVGETSTDELQETALPIVQSSNCIQRMNETESVNGDLIVCAGGADEGPCKVRWPLNSSQDLCVLNLGRQWRAADSSQRRRDPCSCWHCQYKAWRELQPAGLFRLH